ncbi:MAG: M28 family peptidase [Thermodesulfobacteriota bacterium]
MRKYALPLLLSLVILSPSRPEEAPSQPVSGEITQHEVIAHVRYLSSDKLEGRMTGEKGSTEAARYIARDFEQSGLEPLGDGGNYFQKFPLPERVIPGKLNSLAITINGLEKRFELGRDFFPLAVSASGSASGELVFAGYGISAPELGYDDYRGVDVRGRIVLLLRGSPRDMDYRSHFYDYASFRYKAMNAWEKGAKGIIFTTPDSLDEEEDLGSLAFELPSGGAAVEAAIIRRDEARVIIGLAGGDFARLEAMLSERKSGSFPIPGSEAEMRVDLVTVRGESSNVLGFLPGSDPVLKNQVVVIGAHYDHLGRGQNYSDPRPGKGRVYNGADDNASGVSGLLELGEYFARSTHRLKRSLLFIAFSGEEIGLLGSSFYIEHPAIPAENTVAMINMDMIGRLRENKLTVLGVGSAGEWEGLIDKANAGVGLDLTYMDSAFGPSDQTVFFADKIPSVLFFTGLHKDYHTTGDDWEKINPEGEARVLRLIANLVTELGDGGKVTFSEGSTAYDGPPELNVYLGTVPDYTNREEGVRLSGVKEGSPAERAGLAKGDTVIELDGIRIRNIYDYRSALAVSRPGVAVEVVIIRAGKRISVGVVPEPR